jgi:transposase
MLVDYTDVKVYLACGATDMRKSINGLSAIVQQDFNLDPFDKALFVFCNRHRDRIKILTWEENGFWIHLKRLEQGHFKWPSDADDETMILDFDELKQLLKGPNLEQKIKRNKKMFSKLT